MEWEEEADFEEHLRKKLNNLRPDFEEHLWQKMEARLDEKPIRLEKSWQFFLRQHHQRLLLGLCLLVWLEILIINHRPPTQSLPMSRDAHIQKDNSFLGHNQAHSARKQPSSTTPVKKEGLKTLPPNQDSLLSLAPVLRPVFAKSASPTSTHQDSLTTAPYFEKKAALPVSLPLAFIPVLLPDKPFSKLQIDSSKRPVFAPRFRRWSLYLGGGPEWVNASTALDISPQSSGQLWLEYAFHPHWHLRTGLGYLRHKVDLQNTGNVAAQIITIQPSPGRVLNNIQFQREEAMLMRELEVPFVLQYERPLGRDFYWYVGAGAGISLQLEEKYEYTVSEILVDASNGQRLNFENTTQEREARRQLRAGLLMHAGVVWQPAPGWKIAIEPHFRNIFGSPQLGQTLGTRLLLGYSL
ncbi:MAG: hypothetical protein OHK0053_05850 [Microscillaceae bacterium]